MQHRLPSTLLQIEQEAARTHFDMSCSHQFGNLIRTLVASKPAGMILEIGTGVGAGAAWLLDGMDKHSRLLSIEIDHALIEIAQNCLGSDSRLRLIEGDASKLLETLKDNSVDLLFADFRPGKFSQREDAFRVLKPGGLYIVDDLQPQDTWPSDHQPRVDAFLACMSEETRLNVCYLEWGSGVLVATKKA